MTCLEFTDLALRRMVAAGFEVVPVAQGHVTAYRWAHIDRGMGAPFAEELRAWADAVAHLASGVAS